MEIRILKQQGLSLGEIARETGLAVNTVRKYLDEERALVYTPRPPKPGKLEPFKEYLRERGKTAPADPRVR